METQIKSKLKDIEQRYQVKILYACETGSRAWGFPSPDSDYDVRMTYMHEPGWYMTLSGKKDIIEFMSEDGELDITWMGYPKALKVDVEIKWQKAPRFGGFFIDVLSPTRLGSRCGAPIWMQTGASAFDAVRDHQKLESHAALLFSHVDRTLIRRPAWN